jgi:DNA modification methylase
MCGSESGAGLVFSYDWSIRKNPQAQAITSKSRELQFAGLENDRARSRGALPDYVLKFLVPGDNGVPVDSPDQVSRNDWIDLAEDSWRDIRPNDTLNVREARAEGDTRHICPLQLEIYRRFILLFTNPGEVVFDPFTGMGSCGFVALGGESPITHRHLREPRRFYGCELKPEWHAGAVAACSRAIAQRNGRGRDLFSDLEGGAA